MTRHNSSGSARNQLTIRTSLTLDRLTWDDFLKAAPQIRLRLGMGSVSNGDLIGHMIRTYLDADPEPIPRSTRAISDREIDRSDLSSLSLDPATDRHRYNPELLGTFILWAFPGLNEKKINRWLLELQRYPAEYGNCAMHRTLENRENVDAPPAYSITVLKGLAGKDIQDYLDGVEKPGRHPPRPANRQEPQQGGPSNLIAAQERRDAERPAEEAARAVRRKEHMERCQVAWEAATAEDRKAWETEALQSPAVQHSSGNLKDIALRGAKMAIVARHCGIEGPT